MYTRSFPVAVSPRGLGEDPPLGPLSPAGRGGLSAAVRARRASKARWMILHDVTTTAGLRLIRGQLVHGFLEGSGRARVLVVTSNPARGTAPGVAQYRYGTIPSHYARLRLDGLSGLFGLGQGHEAAHSNVGGRSTGSIIESIGTAFRNVAEGTAAVVREGERASVARAGGSSDDAPPPDMSMYSSPTTTGFLSSTGGKVLIAGAVGLAILATILFLRKDKKEKNRRRNRRRSRSRWGRW